MPLSPPLREQLSGSVRGDGEFAVLHVAGEIDIATISQFRSLVDEALTAATQRVTVDLTQVQFLDAGGLAVLAGAAERLRVAGGQLAVRGATPSIYRLFDVTGLTGTLNVERPAVGAVLLRGLVGAATVPQSRDVLDAALKLVVTMAQAVIVGADGVSITLPRHGRLGTVAASNDVVLDMDHDQYDTGEGPCLDAATQGERFHILSLDDEARWPAFVPRARARGIESILSTPLLAVEAPIGALNVYSRTIGAFAAHEKEWADQFAAEASTVVSSAQFDEPVPGLTGQIRKALVSREVIAVAQGIVMQRDGCSPDAAHVTLMDISRRTGRRLRDVSDELVRSVGGAPPSGAALYEGSAHEPAIH